MKTTKTIIAATMLLAIMTMAVSCGGSSPVDSALSKMEKAMDKVEKNKTSMTDADWKELNAELEETCKILEQALESNDVGVMKKLKISAVVLRYGLVVGEAALHTAVDSLNRQMEESGANDQLKEALNSDELKNAMEELQKALEQKK